ncbi:hypothetical protein Tco_0000687 [Tanacetum coccineum]
MLRADSLLPTTFLGKAVSTALAIFINRYGIYQKITTQDNSQKGKHDTRYGRAQREAKDQSQKQEKMVKNKRGKPKLRGENDYSSEAQQDGRVKNVISRALIGSLKLEGHVAMKKAQGENTISTQDLLVKEKMESQSETTQTVSALKLLMVKTGDYDLWSMRMEQYLTHTDYALWEVIVNGDAPATIASASAG